MCVHTYKSVVTEVDNIILKETNTFSVFVWNKVSRCLELHQASWGSGVRELGVVWSPAYQFPISISLTNIRSHEWWVSLWTQSSHLYKCFSAWVISAGLPPPSTSSYSSLFLLFLLLSWYLSYVLVIFIDHNNLLSKYVVP